jgi:hypothetical protein
MKREDFIHQLSEQEKDSVLRQVEELREHALLLTPEITPVSEHYLRMMLCIVDWQRTTDWFDSLDARDNTSVRTPCYWNRLIHVHVFHLCGLVLIYIHVTEIDRYMYMYLYGLILIYIHAYWNRQIHVHDIVFVWIGSDLHDVTEIDRYMYMYLYGLILIYIHAYWNRQIHVHDIVFVWIGTDLHDVTEIDWYMYMHLYGLVLLLKLTDTCTCICMD